MKRWMMAAATLLAACASAPEPAPAPIRVAAAPARTPPPANDYADPATWLCRPGRQDACAVDLTATIVPANGRLSRERFASDPNAPIDCFYVYPTVSRDPTPNSDMNAGPEELSVIATQFARFSSKCRPFAPLYRQVTLTALASGIGGRPMEVDRTLAYDDVLAAWRHYLAHDNNGRGVVLIGHSQGSGVLTQLIRNEIDGKPIQAQIVSALLIGTNVAVPRGADVGGAFQHMPVCRAPTQTGCVVAYASFRDTVPPPPNSRFARPVSFGGAPPDPNLITICANPAALGGGRAPLRSYMVAQGVSSNSPLAPDSWTVPPQEIATNFVATPGLLSAECVSDERGTYLSIHVNADPNDARTDDIRGDVLANGVVQADWGLHLQDMQIAMGDLVDLVGRQGRAFLARR